MSSQLAKQLKLKNLPTTSYGESERLSYTEFTVTADRSVVLYEEAPVKPRIQYLQDMLNKLLMENAGSKSGISAIQSVVAEAVEDENLNVVHAILDGRLRINQMPNAARPLHEAMAEKRKGDLQTWLNSRLNAGLISKVDMQSRMEQI